jgi:hypothetical protein
MTLVITPSLGLLRLITALHTLEMAGRSLTIKPSSIPQRVSISREGPTFNSVPSIPHSHSEKTYVFRGVRLNLAKALRKSSSGVQRSLVKSRSKMPLAELKSVTKKAKYDGILHSEKPKPFTSRVPTALLEVVPSSQTHDKSRTISFKRASPERFLSNSNRLTSTSSPLLERPSTQMSAKKLDSVIGDCSQFEHKAHQLYSQLSRLKSRLRRRFREVKDNSPSPEPRFARSYVKNFVSDFRHNRATVVHARKFQVLYVANFKAED